MGRLHQKQPDCLTHDDLLTYNINHQEKFVFFHCIGFTAAEQLFPLPAAFKVSCVIGTCEYQHFSGQEAGAYKPKVQISKTMVGNDC